MKHKHHIIPRHMGGSNDRSNIIELSIEEHAEAHRILYEKHGCWQDYVAWQGLAKLNENFNAAQEAMKYGAQKGRLTANNKWKDPVYKKNRLEKWRPKMAETWNNSPCLGKKGAENYAAKDYLITHPDGTQEKVKSLKTWCEQNGLKYNTVHGMCIGRNKTHKGFKIIKLS